MIFNAMSFRGSTVLAISLIAAAGCTTYEPHGTLIEPPMQVPDFTLESGTGDVSRSDFEAKLVAMFFGFTHCPDICPDTMARLAHALRQLDADEAAQIQVLLVSVDPERDTPAAVSTYAERFHPAFIGLSGPSEAIADVASGYGIYHARVPLSDEGDYTVDHTPAVVVLNRQGETVLIWRHGIAPEDMAADLRFLLRRS
jgi:protein SCO1